MFGKWQHSSTTPSNCSIKVLSDSRQAWLHEGQQMCCGFLAGAIAQTAHPKQDPKLQELDGPRNATTRCRGDQRMKFKTTAHSRADDEAHGRRADRALSPMHPSCCTSIWHLCRRRRTTASSSGCRSAQLAAGNVAKRADQMCRYI
jgi:hypothetical protein